MRTVTGQAVDGCRGRSCCDASQGEVVATVLATAKNSDRPFFIARRDLGPWGPPVEPLVARILLVVAIFGSPARIVAGRVSSVRRMASRSL